MYSCGRTCTFRISVWVSVRQLLWELYRECVSNLPARQCHWQYQLRSQFYPTLPFLPTYVLHSLNYSTHSESSSWNPPVLYGLQHYTQNRWLAVQSRMFVPDIRLYIVKTECAGRCKSNAISHFMAVCIWPFLSIISCALQSLWVILWMTSAGISGGEFATRTILLHKATVLRLNLDISSVPCFLCRCTFCSVK